MWDILWDFPEANVCVQQVYLTYLYWPKVWVYRQKSSQDVLGGPPETHFIHGSLPGYDTIQAALCKVEKYPRPLTLLWYHGYGGYPQVWEVFGYLQEENDYMIYLHLLIKILVDKFHLLS